MFFRSRNSTSIHYFKANHETDTRYVEVKLLLCEHLRQHISHLSILTNMSGPLITVVVITSSYSSCISSFALFFHLSLIFFVFSSSSFSCSSSSFSLSSLLWRCLLLLLLLWLWPFPLRLLLLFILCILLGFLLFLTLHHLNFISLRLWVCKKQHSDESRISQQLPKQYELRLSSLYSFWSGAAHFFQLF